jgi:hypothetical protein
VFYINYFKRKLKFATFFQPTLQVADPNYFNIKTWTRSANLLGNYGSCGVGY